MKRTRAQNRVLNKFVSKPLAPRPRAHKPRVLKPSVLVPLVFIAFTLISGCGASKQKLRMVPNLESTLRQVTTLEQDMTMSLGPMGEQSTQSTTLFEMTQIPRERRDDGSTVMEYRYDRIRTETTVGDQVMTMDTDSPSEDELDPFSALVGLSITARITNRGKVLEVSGFDELMDSISSDMSGPEAAQMKELMRSSFGNEAMTSMLQQITPILPEDAVGVGDSWKSETSMQFPMLGDMEVDYAYEVLAFEPYVGSDCVKLGFDYVISITSGDALLDLLRQMMGTDVDLEWEMKDSIGTGSLWLDRATGVVMAMDFTQDISVQMSMGIPEVAEEMDMDFDIRQTMSMETVR